MIRLPFDTRRFGRVIQGDFVGGRPCLGTREHPGLTRLPANLVYGLGKQSAAQFLPRALQAKLERAFQQDFSNVRVHVGPEASAMGARAFATGSDLFFAPGEYRPAAPEGKHLIAHELAHVVQQQKGRVAVPRDGGLVVVQNPVLEAEADRAADWALATSLPAGKLRGATLQRAEKSFDFDSIEHLQETEMSCWAASLSFLFEHLGINISQKQLISFFKKGSYAGFDIDNTFLSLLFKFHSVNGYSWKIVNVDKSGIGSFLGYCAPCVVGQTNPSHYVYVTSYDAENGNVKFYDPWDSTQNTVSVDQFKKTGPFSCVYIYKD